VVVDAGGVATTLPSGTSEKQLVYQP